MIDNETLQNDLAREKYLRDLDKLYASVREWLREIDPDATTDQNARARIQGLREGDYQAPILTIHRRPKDADFALVPRGFDVSGGMDLFGRREWVGKIFSIFLMEITGFGIPPTWTAGISSSTLRYFEK